MDEIKRKLDMVIRQEPKTKKGKMAYNDYERSYIKFKLTKQNEKDGAWVANMKTLERKWKKFLKTTISLQDNEVRKELKALKKLVLSANRRNERMTRMNVKRGKN
jgi:hypothetical protein